MIVMGGLALLMFGARFFLFDIVEPPKYLMGKGRDAEAIAVIQRVAAKNGKESPVTLADLERCNVLADMVDPDSKVGKKGSASGAESEKLDLHHIKALFAERKLAISTSMLMAIWGLIGLGFMLVSHQWLLVSRVNQCTKTHSCPCWQSSCL